MAWLPRNFLHRLKIVGQPLFASPTRWRALGALMLVVSLLLGLNGLNVANSFVGRNFMTAITHRDHALFVRYACLYLLVFAMSAMVAVTAQFVQDRLALTWRDCLTRDLVSRYLTGRTAKLLRARAEVDNPDQRIAEDVRTLTSTLVSFFVMLTNAVLTTAAFVGVLWSIMPTLLFTALGYAALGSIVTIGLGHRLVALDHAQLRKEADLRLGIIRLRDTDPPTDTRMEASAARAVIGRVRRVVHNSRSIISVSRNLGFFTSGYNYLVPLLPILLVAPRYLRGDVEFGVVTQAAMAFAQILGALSLIVAQFQTLAAFAAVVHRLGALREAMDAYEHGADAASP